MRRERYRGSQLNRRADEPLTAVVHQSAMFGNCARYRALWAPAGCALRWPCRRTEGVPSGTDDDVNIRLRDPCVNPLRVIDTLPTIAQLPKTCRAEASSMPAGPAVGRVEAQRRALTTPSTAPASRRDGAMPESRSANVTFLPGNTCDVHELVSVRFVSRILPANLHMKTCTRAARLSLTTARADTDNQHDQRWRERPCLDGPGVTRWARHRGRSRHRWFTDFDSDTGDGGGTKRRRSRGPEARRCDTDACTQ